MMKVIIRACLFILTICFANFSFAQSESLTNSPYSLFGLGKLNQNNVGKVNALGRTGIGLNSSREMNLVNPASFSAMGRFNFFFDVGVNAEIIDASNAESSQQNSSYNFSHIALAFPVFQNSAVALSLRPYSSVGYSVIGIQTNVEGSNDIYLSNILGSGGINDLKLSFGTKIGERLSLGIDGSVLFGQIEETEDVYVEGLTTAGASNLQTVTENNYSGLRATAGIQYNVSDDIILGATATSPSILSGKSVLNVIKSLDGLFSTVENETEDDLDDFELPLEVGFGFSSKINDKLLVTADYRKSFWTQTNQKDNLGEFKDQDFFGFGAEYTKAERSFKYLDLISYRAGFNFDNGYFTINDSKLNNWGLSLGLGLPLRKVQSITNDTSSINISYTYGQNSSINNVLISEKYHLITINISMSSIGWFQKRRIY